MNHYQVTKNYSGSLELLTELFLRDIGPEYAPFFSNVLGYWNRREHENILVTFYEDMQRDLPSVIRKVADFLDKKAMSDDDVAKLCDHLSFDKMKANPMTNLDGLIDVRFLIKNLIFIF